MSGGVLRVLQSAQTWLPRTQTWMYNQVRFLPDSVESHIVCDRTAHLDEFGLANIHSLADRGLPYRIWDRGLRFLRVRRHPGLLVRVARRTGARLLHSHFGPIGWRGLPAARRADLRHVVTFYGLDLGRVPRADPRWKSRYEEMFAAVDRVLCEGSCMARAIAALGCPPEKVTVQHLGLDLDAVGFRPRRWDGSGPLRVLLAASFTEKKGLVHALEALASIRREVELEVTVIGDANAEPRNREEKARILRAVEEGGLEPRMLGYRSHERLHEEAYAHHLFLSPSVTAADGDTEGGAPVTILEMAASGMPVVSTRHADIPEVLPEGRCGLLAPERDPGALADHLRALAAHPERWEDLVRAAREHIEREYDVRRQAERLAAIYAEVAA